MVTSVVGISRQGIRDWMIQRVSAVIMAVYSIGMIIFFLKNPDLDYVTWHFLFSSTWMKLATLLFFASLLFHAWVGIWTVLTDYVKCYIARFTGHVVVFFGLAACFFWALLILWGV